MAHIDMNIKFLCAKDLENYILGSKAAEIPEKSNPRIPPIGTINLRLFLLNNLGFL